MEPSEQQKISQDDPAGSCWEGYVFPAELRSPAPGAVTAAGCLISACILFRAALLPGSTAAGCRILGLLFLALGFWALRSLWKTAWIRQLRFQREGSVVSNTGNHRSNILDLDQPHQEYRLQISFHAGRGVLHIPYTVYSAGNLDCGLLAGGGGSKAVRQLCQAGAVLIPEDTAST